MTDNGSAYKSHLFRSRHGRARCRHKRTRPYTPKTNGKAERFIQTSLREWAYAKPFHSSAERTDAMRPWLADYNHSQAPLRPRRTNHPSAASPGTTSLAMTPRVRTHNAGAGWPGVIHGSSWRGRWIDSG